MLFGFAQSLFEFEQETSTILSRKKILNSEPQRNWRTSVGVLIAELQNREDARFIC